MKKIVFLIALTLIGSVCFAQRNGGSRGSNSRSSSPRSSVSARPSSSSRSSVSSSRTASYNPSRSSATHSNVSTRTSAPRSTSFSRSETRSTRGTTNPTTAVRNTPRSQNNGVNMDYRHNSHPNVSSNGTPVHGRPHSGHHPNVDHHPYHSHPVPHGMHPMPPMHHPIHHRPIHMHYHLYHRDYWFVHNLYWHDYWYYVHTYPYNEVIIYANNARPGTETLAIVTDDNYVYTLYRDNYMNETYFTISDINDNVLVKTIVHRKYCKLIPDNNGVWLLKKRDRDPIYFMYQDGNLYRYEED